MMTTATLGNSVLGIAGVRGVPPRMAASAPRLRLTGRGRRFITVLISLPLVVAAFWFAVNGGGASATLEGSAMGFEYVTVEPGESLWRLAEQIAPQADPRDVIADVMQLNQLDSADVFAGQELAIPALYVD